MPENLKKYEYAIQHFTQLNNWLHMDGIPTYYQFNMLSPKNYNIFFQKLREKQLVGFRSDLDIAMTKR